MTARIIKANWPHDASAIEAFNFVDLQRQGDDILASARTAADAILETARHDAAAISCELKQEAERSGREEGLRNAADLISRQAQELAEQLVNERLATALPALQAAATALQSERDEWLLRWEHSAVRLGVTIAEKLIQRQLISRPEIATAMIADALRLAAGQEKVTVYLHPEDLAAWGDRSMQIVESLTACADARLVPDERSLRGGCRIETRHGEIDARVETMLHRIAEELIDG